LNSNQEYSIFRGRLQSRKTHKQRKESSPPSAADRAAAAAGRKIHYTNRVIISGSLCVLHRLPLLCFCRCHLYHCIRISVSGSLYPEQIYVLLLYYLDRVRQFLQNRLVTYMIARNIKIIK